MSFVDDFAFEDAPGRFDTGVTGIEATFYVTLRAGRGIGYEACAAQSRRQGGALRILDVNDAGSGVGTGRQPRHRRR
jgi:hypothetical protein